jgi:hypothetical protein
MAKNVTDLDEHKSLDQLSKEVLSLKRENQAAMKTIEKLLKDLSKKNEEIAHLQTLVSTAVPVKVPEKKKNAFQFTPEEEIAMIQLDRLRKIAATRALTLEETKIYDLLVKNKRLSQDESTVNLSKAQYRDVSEVDLLQIASTSDEPTDKNQ